MLDLIPALALLIGRPPAPRPPVPPRPTPREALDTSGSGYRYRRLLERRS